MATKKDLDDAEREGWPISDDTRAATLRAAALRPALHNRPKPGGEQPGTSMPELLSSAEARVKAWVEEANARHDAERAERPAKRKRSTFRDPQGEDLMQIRFFEWARSADVLARWPELRWIHHPANGGGRSSRVEGAHMKRMGVLPGVLDVHLPVPRGAAHGWYCEFKFGRNELTDDQAAFVEFALLQGYHVIVIRDDWTLARDELISYLETTR